MRSTRIGPSQATRVVVGPLAAVAFGVILLVGCGSSSEGSSPTTTTTRPHPASTTTRLEPAAFDIVGQVTDPGPAVTDLTPTASLSRFTLTGGSHWAGGLEGDTTYTGPGFVDTKSGDSDVHLDETFKGSLPGLGSGSLECDDFMHNNADGSGSVDLWVVRGRGDLSGLTGYLRFTWTSTNPDGSIKGGEFHGVLYRS